MKNCDQEMFSFCCLGGGGGVLNVIDIGTDEKSLISIYRSELNPQRKNPVTGTGK